jgi:hypothetical protein
VTTDVRHTDVAAYAFGLLEAADRRAFTAHLGDCARCTRELGEFTGMTGLLAGIGPEDFAVEDDAADLLRDRRTARRAHRRRTALLGAAAGVALLAGGALAGALATGGPRAPASRDVFASGDRAAGTDTRTGVTGTVAMRGTGWGTDVGLELSHLRGPLVCRLVAVSTTGERRTVTEWSVPPRGYGVPGAPASLRVHGGTALARTGLARFDVVAGRSTLLSIPVRQ